MDESTVIVIDGCKISPEFIDLVKQHFNTMHGTAEGFKTILFDAQVGILAGIAANDIVPTNLDRLVAGIQNLYYFFDTLEDLHKQGKF